MGCLSRNQRTRGFGVVAPGAPVQNPESDLRIVGGEIGEVLAVPGRDVALERPNVGHGAAALRPVAIEAAGPLGDPPAFGGASSSGLLEVGRRLHERHQAAQLLVGDEPAPARHPDGRVDAKLELLRVLAQGARHAVEDPLADLPFVSRVHRDQAPGEGRDVPQAVSRVGHAPNAARAVAGEAALRMGDGKAALHGADVGRAPVSEGRVDESGGQGQERDRGNPPGPRFQAPGPRVSAPSQPEMARNSSDLSRTASTPSARALCSMSGEP